MTKYEGFRKLGEAELFVDSEHNQYIRHSTGKWRVIKTIDEGVLSEHKIADQQTQFELEKQYEILKGALK